jgi:hypothetical protein
LDPTSKPARPGTAKIPSETDPEIRGWKTRTEKREAANRGGKTMGEETEGGKRKTGWRKNPHNAADGTESIVIKG